MFSVYRVSEQMGIQYKRGVFMACLTRDLQRELSRYIKSNVSYAHYHKPTEVRRLLINKGVCSSSITIDQMEVILKSLH